jgi:hypothetical protein
MLAAMDGNNSLKLIDSTLLTGTHCQDDWTSSSSRWIKPEDVDLFKDEVKNVVCSINFTLDIVPDVACDSTGTPTWIGHWSRLVLRIHPHHPFQY